MAYRLISLHVVPHSPSIPGREESISLLQKFHTGYGAHLASCRRPFSGEDGRHWNVTGDRSAPSAKVTLECDWWPFCTECEGVELAQLCVFWLPVCLYACLSICLSVSACLPACLSVCMSLCLPPCLPVSTHTFMMLIGKFTLSTLYYCGFFDSNFRLLCPPCVQYWCRFIFLQVTSLIIFCILLQICFHSALAQQTDCCSNLTIIPGQRNAAGPAACELRSANRPCLWFTYIPQSRLIQYNSQHILSALYLLTPERSHYTVNLITET